MNVIGAVLQILYIFMYFRYTKEKVSMLTLIFNAACVCERDFQLLGILFVCVSESGGVSDCNSRDHPVLWLALLQHVPTQRRDSAQPARLHL